MVFKATLQKESHKQSFPKVSSEAAVQSVAFGKKLSILQTRMDQSNEFENEC